MPSRLSPWMDALARGPLLWLRQQALRLILIVLMTLVALIAILLGLWIAFFFLLEPYLGPLLAALATGFLFSLIAGLGAWLLSRKLGQTRSPTVREGQKAGETPIPDLPPLEGVVYAFVLGMKYGRRWRERRPPADNSIS